MARLITVAQRKSEKDSLHWTRLAQEFLVKAPDRCEVLKVFVTQFQPSGEWTGSLAAILEAHAPLLDELGAYPDLAACIAEQRTALKRAIEACRQSELARDRERDERFE
jgi:hypothetical protein